MLPAPRKRRGRKTILNDHLEAAFLDAISHGRPIKQAALLVGIHPSTVHDWISKGTDAQARADGGEPLDHTERAYADFADKVTRARAKVVDRYVGVVEKASLGGFVTSERTRRYRERRWMSA